MGMQEKGNLTSHLFSRWMDHFIKQLEEGGNLFLSNGHLIILDVTCFKPFKTKFRANRNK